MQTHRDPREAVASACSLSAEATRGWSTVFEGAVIGRTQLDMLSDAVARFTSAREKYDPAQFVDVEYDGFVADPVGRCAGSTRRSTSRGPRRWRSGSTYRWGVAAGRPAAVAPLRPRDYGLTEAEVLARF